MENKTKSTWNLISGILFIGIGSFRVYKHFFTDSANYSNFTLILAVAFIGYGFYRLYGYFGNK